MSDLAPEDLRLGEVRASVCVTGGGLRLLRQNGVALVEEYPAGVTAPAASGAVLFPWPNRVRDGRWRDGDVDRQLVVTEPGRRTANHGLVTGSRFLVTRHGPAAVTLTAEVRDEPGYPFHVRLELTYRLLPDGLSVGATVRNLGDGTAPFALGFHPYLRVGDHPLEDLLLDLDVDRVVDVDDRLLPVAVRPVGGAGDRRVTPLAGASLNDCFRSRPGPLGRHVHRLVAPDGAATELRTDPGLGWVQVYTCADFPRPAGSGTAVAVEPMSAPPDALNSGTDLVRLAPAASWSAGWSLHAVPGSAAP